MEVNYNSGQKKYILTVDQVELDFLKKGMASEIKQGNVLEDIVVVAAMYGVIMKAEDALGID